jgi:predicted transcriptional regulator of viral defense system
MSGGISAEGRAELAKLVRPGQVLVSVDEAARGLGNGRAPAAKKLARWANNGWLRRVRRGLYLLVPVDASAPKSWTADPLYVATAVWAPCYFTGWTAAHHWELTEQVFLTTVLKSGQRVRQNEQRLLDHDYLVVHAPVDQLEWGLQSIWQNGTRIQIADRARTVVDILDAPRLGGGIRLVSDILRAYLEDHPKDVLVEYADRLGNGAIFKRLGYLIEELRLDAPTLVEACLRRLRHGVSLLDPNAPTSGPTVSRWRLRLNSVLPREGAS